MSKTKVETKLGDLFLVPVKDSKFGIGQVATLTDTDLYIVMYDGIWDEEDLPNSKEIVEFPIVLASLSQDAKIWNGDWAIIGNDTSTLESIKKPSFLVHYFEDDSYHTESFDRENIRPSLEEEMSLLTKRFVASPKRLENALKALNGEIDWSDNFDKLLYSSVIKRSQIIF